MADEGDVLKNLDAAPAGNGNDTAPVAGIISQYVKDLSVENPKAPESFRWQDTPKMDVQFNIAARPASDDVTEVELKITVTAKAEGGTAYIVDLAYCGLVGMRNMGEQQQHMFLYAEAPRILFPFARRVVSDAIRDAGFAPLMLDPIDFNGLYVQRMQQQQAAAGGAAAPAGGAPAGGES
ncbi:protein-export chaperone SecB [Aurantiacibacter sp. MUD11]|uniref:protein-export chaperone SecB n=1 Tax=Aurantiacibacter sp. MUD11 TaxID=3003265 RepID=UPI0022AABA8D|nr:protein-export chaperone SecB [Aurantiacibacter sp. MUD11]WAT19322.1 protein-export chaperone SecB [Aurantiacibacter sp. MUD11]